MLILLAAMGTAFADRRVALVIGNSRYENADKLSNPATDARNVRDALTKLHFDVIYGEDLDKRGLERAIGRFAGPVQEADVALVYFAGHGATFGDTPYVVPVDAQFTSLEAIPYELVPVEALIGELRRAKGVRIAILDACRDNSAEQNLKTGKARGGAISRGLAPVKNPEGLILAYATQYLATAADGDPAGDSPFTEALLANIATPGLDIKDLFFRVGSAVVGKTNGRQRPEISVSFYEPYSLTPTEETDGHVVPAPAAPSAPANPQPSGDEDAWAAVKNGMEPGPLRTFMERFPNTSHRDEAAVRLRALDDGSWQAAAGRNDLSLLHRYLSLFPSGTHAGEARGEIAALESGPAPVRTKPVVRAATQFESQIARRDAPDKRLSVGPTADPGAAGSVGAAACGRRGRCDPGVFLSQCAPQPALRCGGKPHQPQRAKDDVRRRKHERRPASMQLGLSIGAAVRAVALKASASAARHPLMESERLRATA